jgi:hypothetical protein
LQVLDWKRLGNPQVFNDCAALVSNDVFIL